MWKPAGETSYTCMLNAQAGVESDLTVSFIDGSSTAPWEPSFQVFIFISSWKPRVFVFVSFNDVRFSQGKGFYIAAGGGSAYQSFTHIRKTIEDNRFDAKLVNLSDSICLLSIQGPKR
jgi:sarcosine dehydrogenase